MSQLTKKFIGNDQVDSTKIKLDNNTAIRARNAANSADVNVIKLDASDVVQVTGALNASGAVTGSNLSGSSSGTNTGDVSLAAVGATPSANGASLSGQTLTLQPFDGTHPGVVTASGGGTTNFLRADGTWAAPTSSGANTTLSNLGTTAINADLIFDTGVDAQVKTKDDTALTQRLYLQTGNSSADASGRVTVASGSAANGFVTGDARLLTSAASGANSGAIRVWTGASDSTFNSGTNSVKSGDVVDGASGLVEIASGAASGTGNSGAITITTGTAGGTRGAITLDGEGIALTANSSNVNVVAGNTNLHPVSGVAQALAFYDGTDTNFVKFQAAASGVTNQTYTLPLADGTNGQVLKTNGSGTLSWVSQAASPTNKKETTVLSAGDITNQYIDLTQVALTDSIIFNIQGAPPTIEGASYDYSVSYTGGAGGKTRITFLNDIATGGPSALVAGNVIQIQYQY